MESIIYYLKIPWVIGIILGIIIFAVVVLIRTIRNERRSKKEKKMAKIPIEEPEEEILEPAQPIPQAPVKEKEKFAVVKEIPVREVRRYRDEETGIITNLLTIEEALSKLMEEE